MGVYLLDSEVGEQQSPQCFAISNVEKLIFTHLALREINSGLYVMAMLYIQCKYVAQTGTLR